MWAADLKCTCSKPSSLERSHLHSDICSALSSSMPPKTYTLHVQCTRIIAVHEAGEVQSATKSRAQS